MIRGIGVDTVSVSEMAGILERVGGKLLAGMFTAGETAVFCNASDPAEYLATRFAAKEAVFKDVAHLLDGGYFDLRMVETLNNKDGSPYVNIN
jgi:phosphopantetheine--protein transferase-like protein